HRVETWYERESATLTQIGQSNEWGNYKQESERKVASRHRFFLYPHRKNFMHTKHSVIWSLNEQFFGGGRFDTSLLHGGSSIPANVVSCMIPTLFTISLFASSLARLPLRFDYQVANLPLHHLNSSPCLPKVFFGGMLARNGSS